MVSKQLDQLEPSSEAQRSHLKTKDEVQKSDLNSIALAYEHLL